MILMIYSYWREVFNVNRVIHFYIITATFSEEGWCQTRWDTNTHAVATFGLLKLDVIQTINVRVWETNNYVIILMREFNDIIYLDTEEEVLNIEVNIFNIKYNAASN